jgi:hypothetical protein
MFLKVVRGFTAYDRFRGQFVDCGKKGACVNSEWPSVSACRSGFELKKRVSADLGHWMLAAGSSVKAAAG